MYGFTMKAVAILALLPLLAACSGASNVTPVSGSQTHMSSTAANPSGRSTSNIQHIVIIEMENRSFDNYFGKYPGVNGIPNNVQCNPDKDTGQCIYPYHDHLLRNYGGPHGSEAFGVDLDNGKMDGFIAAVEQFQGGSPNPDEVMGYHTCDEIPVYCNYAAQYTIADNNFAASISWSIMAHLYLVSAWSAICLIPGDQYSCHSSNEVDYHHPNYAWTDITFLLYKHGVTWGYFASPHGILQPYDQDDGIGQNEFTGTQWSPLPGFKDVIVDHQLGNVQTDDAFIADATAGLLPSVSWVTPPFNSSDHPSANIDNGQAWVKKQIDAVMQGPNWSTTVILLTWDEWGGFYDHVVPPVIDGQGFGFRTPLIIIGPMVKTGYVDHQLLSSDAYLKLIEDEFLGGERIDNNDGRPDPRPDVRENTPGLGDIRNDFE